MSTSKILDEHFRLSMRIDELARSGALKDPKTATEVIGLCRRQVAISPQAAEAFRTSPDWKHLEWLPMHLGFYHLFQHLERSGDLVEARAVAVRADQEGREGLWPGRWASRIARVDRKSGTSRG